MIEKRKDASMAATRREYEAGALDESSASDDPFEQFRLWYDEAVAANVSDVNAMALATASKEGAPSVRTVLLKDADDDGFVFFTNTGSRKGRELTDNPWAALLFYWRELERQVRISGRVEPVGRDESQAYFESRPRESQLAAWASAQSAKLRSREELEKAYDAAAARFSGKPVDLPPHWGGFRLRPDLFEFWQGRPHRLHDRLEYRRSGEVWSRARLAP